MKFAEREETENTLKIVKDGYEYTLPVTWALDDAGSYTFNNKVEDRAFAHGGDIVGDGLVKGHTIKVEFIMQSDTEADHDELLNRAYRYFYQTDYKLYCGRQDRCFNVAGVSKFSHEYIKGFRQRMSEVKVTLLLADPFRYQGQETEVIFDYDIAQSRAEMAVHNLGSVDTPLTFRFIPKSSMSSITIWQKETKKQFQLSDAQLISPKTSVVNTKEGTVWRDTANAINTFSGQFLSAVPGKNTLFYTGGAGRLEISFTNRWFI